MLTFMSPRPSLCAGHVEEAREPSHQSGLQQRDSPASSSILRKKVSGCAEVSTSGAVKLSKLILDEDMPSPERCRVVWVGKAGLQAGRAGGLQLLNPTENPRGA